MQLRSYVFFFLQLYADKLLETLTEMSNREHYTQSSEEVRSTSSSQQGLTPTGLSQSSEQTQAARKGGLLLNSASAFADVELITTEQVKNAVLSCNC